MFVAVDADRNTHTGDVHGYDHWLGSWGGDIEAFAGKDGKEVYPKSLHGLSVGRDVTVSINRRDLGNTNGFYFYASAQNAHSSSDDAPDGAQPFLFVLPTKTLAWKREQVGAFPVEVKLPSGWIVMPASKQGRSEATRLFDVGDIEQSLLLSSYLNDSFQHQPGDVFDAVQFPANASPIATDLVVRRVQLPIEPNRSDLARAGQAIFDSLRSDKDFALSTAAPMTVDQGGGRAERVAGSARTSGFGGRRSGFVSYVFAGERAIWTLTFRTDNADLSAELPIIQQVANSFRTTPAATAALVSASSPSGAASSITAVGWLILAAIALYAIGLAVINQMKGKTAFAVFGLVVHVLWVVGAIRLAQPDSWWARRFYGHEKLARSVERYPDRGLPTTPCISCGKPLRAGSLACPRCGAEQRPSIPLQAAPSLDEAG